MAQQKEIISTINSLIETLKDGEEGFKQAAEAVKEQLEDDGYVEMSEQMRNTDIEYDFDLEVTGGPALQDGQ